MFSSSLNPQHRSRGTYFAILAFCRDRQQRPSFHVEISERQSSLRLELYCPAMGASYPSPYLIVGTLSYGKPLRMRTDQYFKSALEHNIVLPRPLGLVSRISAVIRSNCMKPPTKCRSAS